MKTVTITLHDTDNCGSSLQSFALQHFLHNNGIENEIINYIPDYTRNNGDKFRTIIRKIIFYKDSCTRDKKFRAFVCNYLKLTKRKYRTYMELEQYPPEADCYITGSDQIWNSMYACGKDAAFYLAFIKNVKKISYAASLGRETIPEDNLRLIKQYAQEFDWISVREKSSVLQLEKTLTTKKVDYVCDPVLLNPIEAYDIIRVSKIISEPYILVYVAQLADTKLIELMVNKIKQRVNGKVVLIGSYRNRCTCDIHIRDVAPGEFLSLISNAEYVISNSFHATMFSLMYQKQFATLLPLSNGSRIKEVLDLVGISNHALANNLDSMPWITEDEYCRVQEKLELFRKKSQQLLLNELVERE